MEQINLWEGTTPAAARSNRSGSDKCRTPGLVKPLGLRRNLELRFVHRLREVSVIHFSLTLLWSKDKDKVRNEFVKAAAHSSDSFKFKACGKDLADDGRSMASR
jgi:hypothetical protein